MIITKRGDFGKTSLFNGKKIWKDDKVIEALGSLDELSSFIGLVRGRIKKKKEKFFLLTIQKDLYQIMAVLAGKNDFLEDLKKNIKIIEQLIVEKEKKMTKSNRFLLSGGNEISSWFHILRTISRRGERRVIGYFKKIKADNDNKKIILQYLNRLSDLFFVMARDYNQEKEITV